MTGRWDHIAGIHAAWVVGHNRSAFSRTVNAVGGWVPEALLVPQISYVLVFGVLVSEQRLANPKRPTALGCA